MLKANGFIMIKTLNEKDFMRSRIKFYVLKY
jgi:hypothetical protein